MEPKGEQVIAAEHEITMEVAKKAQNMKTFGFAFGGVVAAVIVLMLLVGVYRVYAKTATDSFTLGVASVLRLPAAKINDQTVYYTDFANDLRAISTLRDYDRAHPSNANSAANLTDQQLSDQVLIRMINNVLVGDKAKEMGIIVDANDLKDVQDQLKQRFTTLDEAEKGLKEHYGWTLAQYEDRVVRPLILQNKISEKITTDIPAREAIKVQAQSILDQIKGGASFEDMAKKYGQDGTAPSGGDLGDFKPGDMVPEFEAGVKALKKGQVGLQLVESPYGYHIVRLDAVHQKGETIMVEDLTTNKMVAQRDEKGKIMKYTDTTYHAHHILFMFPNLNQQLAAKLKETSFHLYIKVHNPLENTAAAK